MRTKALFWTGILCMSAGLAQAQTQFSDPKQTVDDVFWPKLYAAGGHTLYCGVDFGPGGGPSFTASRVYSIPQIKSVLDCATDNQCQAKSGQYNFMLADLHNIYPELTSVELVRRSSLFSMLPDAAVLDENCALKKTFQSVEPRDAVKGDVARAILYMNREYDLPVPGDIEMFKDWSRQDPPDAEEKARNERIAQLQGNRNPFIDDPKNSLAK